MVGGRPKARSGGKGHPSQRVWGGGPMPLRGGGSTHQSVGGSHRGQWLGTVWIPPLWLWCGCGVSVCVWSVCVGVVGRAPTAGVGRGQGPGRAAHPRRLVPVAHGVPDLGCHVPGVTPAPALLGMVTSPRGPGSPRGTGHPFTPSILAYFSTISQLQCHIPLPPFPPLSQPVGSRWSEFLGVWAGLTFLSSSLCPNLQKIVAFFFLLLFFPPSLFLSPFPFFLGSSALPHACAGT